jgi:hypothetical protein
MADQSSVASVDILSPADNNWRDSPVTRAQVSLLWKFYLKTDRPFCAFDAFYDVASKTHTKGTAHDVINLIRTKE